MLPTLGIIAGKGDIPLGIAEIYERNGGKCFIAKISDDCDIDLDKHHHKNFAIGQAGGIIKYFKEAGVQNIIIIGGVDRPDLSALKADFVGSKLLTQILKNQFLGDDKVLTIVANFLEKEGFKVISPYQILSIDSQEANYHTKKTPSKIELSDITLGQKVLMALGEVDVGQSVIVNRGYVLGIEAAEGTDNLIRRCEILRRQQDGGVLIKIAKTRQDLRLDIPTIGPETVFTLAKHNFSGIAISRKEVMIVKPEETFQLANKYGLFIHVFEKR